MSSASACADTGVDSGAPDSGVVSCITQITDGSVQTKNGVLTNHPELTYTASNGGFTVTTLNMRVRTTSSNTLMIYGDVTNTSGSTKCLVDVTVNVGSTSATGLVYGTEWVDDGSSFGSPTSCLGAGESAPFVATASNVSSTAITSASNVSFVFSDFTLAVGTYVPHTARPVSVTSTRTTSDSCGSIVHVTLSASPTTIYNVAVGIFARDANGLLTDWATAYHLSDIVGGTTVSFDTTQTVASSASVVLVPTFLVH